MTATGSNDWKTSNNPMNVKATDIDWQDETTRAGAKWESFKTLPAGIRAGMLSILSKWRRGAHTPYDITKAFAPASDGNDVEQYSSFVARWLGLFKPDGTTPDPHAYVDLRNPKIALAYALAVLAIENGVFVSKNIDLHSVVDGVNAALQYVGFPVLPL